MLLNGVVDASVNGGISNYKVKIANHLERIDIQTLIVIWGMKKISLWLISYQLALFKLLSTVYDVKTLIWLLFSFFRGWVGGGGCCSVSLLFDHIIHHIKLKDKFFMQVFLYLWYSLSVVIYYFLCTFTNVCHLFDLQVFYSEGYGESEIQLHLVHKLKDITKNQVKLLISVVV